MKGFTLVELVIVMILISIISALGVGLFSSTSAFDARLASDQWLVSLRLSQKLALLRQHPSQLLTFTASQNTDQWDVRVAQGGSELNAINIDRNQVELRSSNSDFASACSTLPLASFPMVLYVNGYGDQVNASRVQLSANTRLCFVATETVELCISPSGYAYGGACLP